MKRFTVLSLMLVIAAVAVGIAALRGANETWASVLLMVTPFLFLIALIAAVCGQERARTGRLGFAILGGGYFAIAFLGLLEGNLARLPTSMSLRFVHERVKPSPIQVTRTVHVPYTVTKPVTTTTKNNAESRTVTTFRTVTAFRPQTVSSMVFNNANGAGKWRAILPGAANFTAFSVIGHCLFALLFGMVGVFIARRFEGGRQSFPAC